MMHEKDNSYFKQALSDFAYDAACGAQIRHLTDLGYCVKQIVQELDVPAPYRRVQETVTRHLRDSKVLLMEKPGSGDRGKTEFIKEYDRYGRASFRRVIRHDMRHTGISWREYVYVPDTDGSFWEFLKRKIEENGEEFSYISCDFGLDRERTKAYLGVLDTHQREYVEGILWEAARMYHRLTPVMQAIAVRLYEQNACGGECYFEKTGERIIYGKDI